MWYELCFAVYCIKFDDVSCRQDRLFTRWHNTLCWWREQSMSSASHSHAKHMQSSPCHWCLQQKRVLRQSCVVFSVIIFHHFRFIYVLNNNAQKMVRKLCGRAQRNECLIESWNGSSSQNVRARRQYKRTTLSLTLRLKIQERTHTSMGNGQ